MRGKTVLLIKAGEAAQPIRREVGDYDRWFLCGTASTGARFRVVQPYLGERLPRDAKGFDSVIMTGSALSVTEPTDWMRACGDFLLAAAERHTPVLGVCFGHQILGMACGVPVVVNPKGREIGTIQVTLTAEGAKDPLFEGLPAEFPIQATHSDIVPKVPRGARWLAFNALAKVQAMALGRYARGVQFHPELSADGLKSLIRTRLAPIDAEGVAEGEPYRGRRILEGVRHAPYGPRILRNFLTRF